MRTSLLFLFAAATLCGAPETRTWTDTQGRTIEAAFVKADEKTVTVLRDGKEVAIPLASLSGTDLAWIHNTLMAIDASIYVIQVVEGGVIATGGGPRLGDGKHCYLEKRVFIACDNKGLTDDQGLKLRIWRKGTYAYETAIGARATIPAYTTTPLTFREIGESK